jgi:hypothetical protein
MTVPRASNRRPKNALSCRACRRFVMRAVERDAADKAKAAARVNAAGQTVH